VSLLPSRCLLILALVDLLLTFNTGCGGNDSPAEPTATHTPVATETPTAIPTVPPTVYQLYDDFSQDMLDEKAWAKTPCGPSAFIVAVQDGALRLERTDYDAPAIQCSMSLTRPSELPGSQVNALRARIQVPSAGARGSAFVHVKSYHAQSGGPLYAEIGLTSDGSYLQVFYQYRDHTGGERSWVSVAPASFGEWYDVQVRLDPDRSEWVFKLNDADVGVYQPVRFREVDSLSWMRMERSISVYLGEIRDPFVALFDDVWAVTSEPAVQPHP